MRIFTALMVSLIVAVGGCKSSIEKQFEAEKVVIAPPMDHDPTQPVELARWWSNGTHLLRLDKSAAYALYDSVNRYAPPIERGRWAKESYALVWLEPYNTATVEPRRVALSRINGKLALTLPKLAPMYALEGPPAMLEDRMIGWWGGPFGTLHLRDDLRYTLMPPPDGEAPDGEADRRRVFGKGRWRIAEDALMLHSDVPGFEPLHLPLKIEGEQITIAAPRGEMARTTQRR